VHGRWIGEEGDQEEYPPDKCDGKTERSEASQGSDTPEIIGRDLLGVSVECPVHIRGLTHTAGSSGFKYAGLEDDSRRVLSSGSS